MIYPSGNQRLSTSIQADLEAFNRRSFLKAGLGLAIATSTVLTLGCSSDAPLKAGLKALTASQQAVFDRLISVLLPTKDTSMASIEQIPVLENIDHLFSSLHQNVLDDLAGAITLFEYGSIVLGGHFSRFTHLSDADAIAYIDAWQNSNAIQRGIVTTLKKMVYASYWRDEKTWAPVDYDGPVSARWGLPSLGNAPLPAEL